MKKYKTFAIILAVLFLLTAAGCKNKRTSTPITPDNGVPETEIVVFLRDHIHEYVDHYESFKIMDTNHSVQRVIDQGTQYIVDYLDLYFDVFTEKEIVKMYNSSIVIREEDEYKWNWTNYHFEKISYEETMQESPEEPVYTSEPETSEATPEPMIETPSDTVSFVKQNGETVHHSEDLNPFDIIMFGEYPQTDDESNEAIEWYVVDKNEDAIVLVSVKILDCLSYNNVNIKIRYKECDLFDWLQSTFKEQAFTEEEQVFLCSDIELIDKSYAIQMAEKGYLKESFTEYAKDRGMDKRSTWCWISDKNTQSVSEFAICIRDDGKISSFEVNFKGIGVRPMIKIRNW